MIYTIAAYSITLGVLAIYCALLQHRSRLAASTLAQAGVDAVAVRKPQEGFNVGASLLAPLWLCGHGLYAPGLVLLLVWGAIWPLYQRELWLPLLFVAAIPIAAGAALGFVGNRIVVERRGLEDPAAFSASQLPWTLAGIGLYTFVLPWVLFFATRPAGPA